MTEGVGVTDMYDTTQPGGREARQDADISSPAAVERIWRDARAEARQESVDRERRAARGRVPFGFSDR
ncbi:hypothetical protein [Mycobacterium haemophilum]|uniref:Uncharacterized protein n=1 Tax=Mycobacterium haemophilum TaxID=29311 RepID=A0A0I9TMA9_9MYCO|nr:hypothetical protein [Mycobacterium haemophilum]KLO29520.1 hypothetical protein ABH39_12070 [Mycobacterium haemophilum]KLO35971.1 hypothetical protein ABH38_13910 [Mycobacterium haemophilum]KLO41530.1 hypothetical protein ABH37_13210 [Mycobacterium haemophilum]KLO49409.1 hypothetical protein ABH36_12470 [Mycobacterium haemophilum]